MAYHIPLLMTLQAEPPKYDCNYELFLVQKQDVRRYARKHRLTHLPISRQWEMCEDVSPWELDNAKYYYGKEWE